MENNSRENQEGTMIEVKNNRYGQHGRPAAVQASVMPGIPPAV